MYSCPQSPLLYLISRLLYLSHIFLYPDTKSAPTTLDEHPSIHYQCLKVIQTEDIVL